MPRPVDHDWSIEAVDLLKPCRFPEQDAGASAPFMRRPGASQGIENHHVVVMKFVEHVPHRRDFYAGFFRTPKDFEPPAAIVKHLWHKREVIERALCRKGGRYLGSALHFNVIAAFQIAVHMCSP